MPDKCFVSSSVDGILRLWKPDDLMCWRSVHPPTPSDLAANERALRKEIEDAEQKAFEQMQNSLNSVDMESPEDESPLHSPGLDSPDTSPRRRGGHAAKVYALQDDDGIDTVPPPCLSMDSALSDGVIQDAVGVVFPALQGDDWTRTPSMHGLETEEAEEEAEEEDLSSDDENAVPKDFEGAGGFTKAILWGNVLIASSWDGLIRVWVYTED